MNDNSKQHENGGIPIYLDPDQPLEKRVDDLVSRLTLEEKVSQMIYASSAPAVGGRRRT